MLLKLDIKKYNIIYLFILIPNNFDVNNYKTIYHSIRKIFLFIKLKYFNIKETIFQNLFILKNKITIFIKKPGHGRCYPNIRK